MAFFLTLCTALPVIIMRIPAKPRALLIVLLVYVISLAIALLFMYRIDFESLLIEGLTGDIIATFMVFAFSMLFDNSSMYDPYWSMVPPVLAVYWFLAAGAAVTGPVILLMLVLFYWGTRLTLNWCRGWEGMGHEDWRYDNFRKQFGKFYWLVSLSGIHFFPTAIVFICMVPVYFAVVDSNGTLNVFHILGFLVAFAGTTLELVADEQMKTFKKDPENKNRLIDSGLWKYSRHPNYVGEVMFWFGLWFFCLGAGLAYLWTLVFPVLMLIMFLFISIPMMERKILRTRPAYRGYQEQVPAFLPLPGRWYKKPGRK